jgi:TPP-dependent pyruvate/acetoin dehydrogenase alpha subunit
MSLSDARLLELYRWMLMERLLDERTNALFRMGKVMSMYHPVLGHEAAIVGSGYALGEGDAVLPHYRGKVLYLMRGIALDYFMAGLLGKQEGLGQGRIPVGSHMCGEVSLGLLPLEGLVGAGVALGAGTALAMKLRRQGAATLICFGDGGSNRGDVHEAMNFAAVLKLPAVFFVINNGWAISVRASSALSVTHISERGRAYGMPGTTVDGRDVLKVYAAVAEALERARCGEGPSLVEALVSRWSAHSGNDPDIYRTDAERAEARRVDPVAEYASVLQRRGLLDRAKMEAIEAELKAAIDAAVAYADGCTEPDAECLTRGVYRAAE